MSCDERERVEWHALVGGTALLCNLASGFFWTLSTLQCATELSLAGTALFWTSVMLLVISLLV